MRPTQPYTLVDSLARAVATVLFAAAGVYVAWQLLRELVAPLVLVGVVLGVVRMAAVARDRSRW